MVYLRHYVFINTHVLYLHYSLTASVLVSFSSGFRKLLAPICRAPLVFILTSSSTNKEFFGGYICCRQLAFLLEMQSSNIFYSHFHCSFWSEICLQNFLQPFGSTDVELQSCRSSSYFCLRIDKLDRRHFLVRIIETKWIAEDW